MANTEELYVNLQLLESQTQQTVPALGGLRRVLLQVGAAIQDAFRIAGYKDYLATVRRFGKDLTDELLIMQLSFGKLKVAIADAFAPIAAVVVPMINRAIAALITFSDYLGQFFQELIAGISGQTALAQSARQAAKAENTLAASARSTGSAVRRSLMGFDQINRLTARSGGSGGGSVLENAFYVPDTVSKEIKALVEKILDYLKPLLQIDFSPLRESLDGLKESFSGLADVAGTAMEWLWFQVLTPFAAWVVETLAPALVDSWAAGLDLVTAAVAPVMDAMDEMWAALEPVVAFIGEQVVTNLRAWEQAFRELTGVIQNHSPQITRMLESIAQVMSTLWQIVSPILSGLTAEFNRTFSSILSLAAGFTDNILTSLTGVTDFLRGAFTGNWRQAWDGLAQYLRGTINSVVLLLNNLLSRLTSAVNAVVRVVNSLRFTVPRWVPGIGGQTFGFNLSEVTAPQIPYLARGAVLPANKPFLAMVGDQKHGTNIEAPLATIQEAVALVLSDQVSAMMAGFEALLAENQALRRTVEQIEVGDAVIGQAAERYNRRMAIMRGV